MIDAPTPYNKIHPFLASVKERYLLSKEGSKKNTQHIILDLKGSGLKYQIGDCIGIYPINDPELIAKTLRAMKATGNEIIVEKNSEELWKLSDFLEKKANLTDFSRKLLTEIIHRQTILEKKKYLENLLADGNKELFKKYIDHHELWDVLEENEEVLFEVQELCNLLMPLLPRLYSIASSNNVVNEEVHLAVALLRYESNGHLRKGVCTHYLCDLVPLNEPKVPVYIQAHHGFTLPSDPQSAIIMIGPGTGIAPFRAFMQERMHQKSPGKNWLFFGEWNRESDFFYQDFWQDLESKGNLRLNLAFSRDQEYKHYVQHEMIEKGKELFQWFEDGAYIYVCGDAQRMAKDVEATLLAIIQEHGNLNETQAREYLKNLRTSKRYLRDIY